MDAVTNRLPAMTVFQIILRCRRDSDHAKVIRIDQALGMAYVDTLAQLLDGSSHLYIHPPGDRAPIGRCSACGAQLKSEISQVMLKQDVAREFRSRDRILQQEDLNEA